MSLSRRVFAINAALLLGAALVLAVSPATVSGGFVLAEVVVLAVGAVVVLGADYVLVKRALAPLERLTAVTERVDLLRPGTRVEVEEGGEEVRDLATSFNHMLDRLESERRESGRRALDAQESERRRIALELHDEVGQLLTGVVLALDALSATVPAEQRRDVERIQDIVRSGAEQVRDIARGLRPESLDDFGLRTALVSLSTAVADRGSLEVERNIDAALPPLAREKELVVYRVAQESLTNVVRHAGASSVRLALARRDGHLELRVRDDGRGIEAGDRGGSGLRGMRERAVYVGGRLDIRPVRPHGTEVVLRVPLEDARP